MVQNQQNILIPRPDNTISNWQIEVNIDNS